MLGQATTGTAGPGLTFVDPALLSARGENLPVLVTADRIDTARRAVEQVGGQVTSELWLIDAVGASIPAAQIRYLAAHSGIRSVVADKQVHAADSPYWDGYVTSFREEKATLNLAAEQKNPVSYLPDGGFVSIDQKGNLLIVNSDGRVRFKTALSGGPFTTPAVIGADGTIYIAGQTRRVFALSSQGLLRWQFAATGKGKFIGGVTLGPDGTVYVADNARLLYALNPITGKPRWRVRVGTVGAVVAPPTVGPDGTVYLSTDKGYVYAVNPSRTLKWSYKSAVASSLSPLVGPSGLVYVVNTGGKLLLGLDANSGVLRFKFSTASPIRANPVIGQDGALFLPTEQGLYGVNPGGTPRFYFLASGGQFKITPVLSDDGTTVYAAVVGNSLFAIDSQTGAQRWKLVLSGNMQASPVLDPKGNVIAGTDQHMFYVIAPDGSLIESNTLSDKITQSASTSPDGSVTVRLGNNKLAILGLLPRQWDGRPDVEPTKSQRVWNLSNAVTIDVGADQLHNQAITGQGVAVAVVDSGVYFNPHVEQILGKELDKQFIGQADFVAQGRCTSAGVQYSGYCFTDQHNSVDRYGHGSHVAGIIWSNIIDGATGANMGIAPDARILSVRVLNELGQGTYADVIEGIQYVVANKAKFNLRVMNLSLSATPTTPYFVDPINRAVEKAWANGIVVLAAAGNLGPAAETITVPGNDPYAITVGAVNDQRTPGYWTDDILPAWSATGPTLDGFLKPDLLAPGSYIISFMYNDGKTGANSKTAYLAQMHPSYSKTMSLFRMSGTSMATAIASGVVALVLQAHPELTPDQVKFRLKYAARPAIDDQAGPVYNLLQQGNGRLWAPDAVLGTDFPSEGRDNLGMDIDTDLAHNDYASDADNAYHYQGAVQRVLSDDGSTYLYYLLSSDQVLGIGAARAVDKSWVDRPTLNSTPLSWNNGQLTSDRFAWGGGWSVPGGIGWDSRFAWGGGFDTAATSMSATRWVDDESASTSTFGDGLDLSISQHR